MDDAKAALIAELETNPGAVIETFKRGKVLEKVDAGKGRAALRALVAEEFPDARAMMPETAVAAAVAPVLKYIADEKARLDADRQTDTENKNITAFAKLLRDQGVPVEQIPAVMKLGAETGNLDPKALALRWKSEQTPARSSAGFGRPQIPGGKNADAYFTGIQDDPDGWLLNRMYTLTDAMEQGRNPDTIDWAKEALA